MATSIDDNAADETIRQVNVSVIYYSMYYSVHFLQNYECERYYQYNQKLLFEEQNQELMKKIDMLL